MDLKNVNCVNCWAVSRSFSVCCWHFNSLTWLHCSNHQTITGYLMWLHCSNHWKSLVFLCNYTVVITQLTHLGNLMHLLKRSQLTREKNINTRTCSLRIYWEFDKHVDWASEREASLNVPSFFSPNASRQLLRFASLVWLAIPFG